MMYQRGYTCIAPVAVVGRGEVNGWVMLIIRTTETDPIHTRGDVVDGIQYWMMSTTVRLQIRVFGKWITVLKWNRVC